MHDAMVALERKGVETAALIHGHSRSFRTSEETFTDGKNSFQVVRVGTLGQFLFTPVSPAFPLHLRRLIKAFKPDVLHLHLPNPSAFWVLALVSARRIPWVLHWHSDVVTTKQSWYVQLFHKFYRPFERALLKRTKAIVTTSQAYCDSSIPLRPWIEKCHVIPLGVDVKRFRDKEQQERVSDTLENNSPEQYSRKSGIAAEMLKVLAVGRLTYYKGFRYLVEAAAEAKHIHVSLVGTGDQEDYLKKLAASLGVQDRVSFLGVLTDPELARQMSICDCLCLPSIERTEAFGMVLLEAMYFGKATVICDVPGSGMGWIVDDGITGIKVKPADAAALVDAFNRLSENHERLVELGMRGKEKFHRQFEIDQAVKALVDLYKKTTPTGSELSFNQSDHA